MTQWIDDILEANAKFRESRFATDVQINTSSPARAVLVTCMDPRINLAAVGLSPLGSEGLLDPTVRITRSYGAVYDLRSIIVAVHLSGAKEIAILFHTDCGAQEVQERADILLANLEANLGPKFTSLAKQAGFTDAESLRDWVGGFSDPAAAVAGEVERLRNESFIADDMVIHGLVLDLKTQEVEVVVNGYDLQQNPPPPRPVPRQLF